jgi:hypothetical protein
MPVRVAVACAAQGHGYRCEVTVYEGGSWTRHVVRVSEQDLERWASGRATEDLVRDSFAFLLQREPKESILKEFDLSIIKRYFPEYDGAK